MDAKISCLFSQRTTVKISSNNPIMYNTKIFYPLIPTAKAVTNHSNAEFFDLCYLKKAFCVIVELIKNLSTSQ